MERLTPVVPRPPWSLLQTQWLDIPIRRRAGKVDLTWGAFSESFDGCLRAVSHHVNRGVQDGADLKDIITEALVANLEVLISPIEESEKHRRLRSAADVLIARRAPSGPGRTDPRRLEDRGGTASDRESDT